MALCWLLPQYRHKSSLHCSLSVHTEQLVAGSAGQQKGCLCAQCSDCMQGVFRRGLQLEAWEKLWSINKRIIDPVCPR